MDAKLVDAIARVLNVDAASLTRESSSATVPGWDSLRQMMLLIELEDTFKVKLPFEAFATATSVGKIEDIMTQLPVHGHGG